MTLATVVEGAWTCWLTLATGCFYISASRSPNEFVAIADHYSRKKWLYVLSAFCGTFYIFGQGFLKLFEWIPGRASDVGIPLSGYFAAIATFVATIFIMDLATQAARTAVELNRRKLDDSK